MSPVTPPPQVEADLPRFEAPNAHIAWLGFLFKVFEEVRRQGPLWLEALIETPAGTDALTSRFRPELAPPYLDFALDLLRLPYLGINDADDLQCYARQTIASYRCLDTVDISLLETIWLGVWGFFVRRHPPLLACEFARQAVPLPEKPSFDALDKLLREWRADCDQEAGDALAQGGLAAAVAHFMKSMVQ